jgi:hypothetical protein
MLGSQRSMARWFNTAGPCKPEDHFMIPPARRVPQVRRVIDQKHYFVLHAPRQSGKTTIVHGLAAELTAEGRYAAAWVSAEQGQPFDDIGAAEAAILGSWARAAQVLPAELRPPPWPEAAPGDRVQAALAAWAEHCPRPLVVLIDALRDDVLVSCSASSERAIRCAPSGSRGRWRSWGCGMCATTR